MNIFKFIEGVGGLAAIFSAVAIFDKVSSYAGWCAVGWFSLALIAGIVGIIMIGDFDERMSREK